MSRLILMLALLTVCGAAGEAVAQTGCQPTIMRPCDKASDKQGTQTTNRTKTAKPDDSKEPIDHSPRLKLDRDTDFKFGTGGLGLQRKF